MPKVTITRSEMEIALERLKGWPPSVEERVSALEALADALAPLLEEKP